MLRLRLAVLIVASAFAVVGCGTHGGDKGDGTTSPTSTPIPTASVTAKLPTPTPAPFSEVALASVVEYSAVSGFLDHTSVLRNVGDGWERLPVSTPRGSYLAGLTFSALEVVWGFGYTDSESPLLLRSDDAGRSWMDVSGQLPAECRRIVDLTFVTKTVAYLMSRGQIVDRRVFVTRNAGQTWTEVPLFTTNGLPSSYALEARGTAVELVRSLEGGTNDGLVVRRVDDPNEAPVQLAPAGGIGIWGASSFSVAGVGGWIAATDAIFASDAPGDDWIEQTLHVGARLDLRAIDVRDANTGIAGGNLVTDDGRRVPVLLRMDADSHSWEQATIVDPSDGLTISDVLRLRGDTAWAVTSGVGTEPSTLLLRSDDGGRTWRVDSVLDQHLVISDFARNTEGR